ncbi:MAG: DUF1566 domain-containing protein [Bacteroidales bacterium]|nr:DUF1566 domain-containing protein [Bacteroidales bacterium]
MKRIFAILAAVLLTATLWAQSPEKMSYQAIIRNSSDQLVTNQAVRMQISILQGSATGTTVYTETQTPSTNANGLISIEIGGGTGFDTINWGNSSYFIKTETDPTGGTNYTITGTSQLLSIPYALHAKTAEILTGTITETDPIFDSSVAAGITDNDISKWSSKQDILTAGTGIDITANVVSATTYSVGDFALGGVIFWVDETGQHGLVCAKQDQSSGIRWYAGSYGRTQAKGDGPFSGEMNTAIIIAAYLVIGDDLANYAASICAGLQITEGGKTYGDWYLPSKGELNIMYQNKTIINATATANGGGSFAASSYWSSSEFDPNLTTSQNFSTGVQNSNSKNNTFRVRAVRSF